MRNLEHSENRRATGRSRSRGRRLAGVALAAVAAGTVAVTTTGVANAAATHNLMVKDSAARSANRSVIAWVPGGRRSGCTALSKTNWNSTGIPVTEGGIVSVQIYSDTNCRSPYYGTTANVPRGISTGNWWFDLKIL
jgi:hypothetical protein